MDLIKVCKKWNELFEDKSLNKQWENFIHCRNCSNILGFVSDLNEEVMKFLYF
jgi:hypothetical protein